MGEHGDVTLNRRQILAGLGTVGAAGGLAGAGTAAVLSDRESVATGVAAGTLDLEVEWHIVDGPGVGRSGSTRGGVAVPIAVDAPDAGGAVEFAVELPSSGDNNPATVWLSTDCPHPAGTRLAGAIGARVVAVSPTTGEELGPPLATGSLRSVARTLRGGVRLEAATPADSACVQPGAPVAIRLEWSVESYVGREETTLPLEFAARQCRNADPGENPFERADGDCGPDECPCCVEVGTLELDPSETDQAGVGDAAIEPGTYDFTEGGEGYRLRVTDTVDVASSGETVAVAARLLAEDGPAPPLCRTAVAGGGDPPGPAVRTYERTAEDPLSPATGSLSPRETGPLYAPAKPEASGSRPYDPGEYYAISHLAVAICPANAGRCP